MGAETEKVNYFISDKNDETERVITKGVNTLAAGIFN